MGTNKVFSTIDFSNSKTTICMFTAYKGIIGDAKCTTPNNYMEILALKKYCIDNNGIIHFVVFSEEDKKYVEDIIMNLYNTFCKNDKKLARRAQKNMRIFYYKDDYAAMMGQSPFSNPYKIFSYVLSNMAYNKIQAYDNIILDIPYWEYRKDKFTNIISKNGKMILFDFRLFDK